eukprot:TRINITY_DN13882_c0_g1_i1.p1 TRINITY_DN13882_c0_g1~~TRINITY_DN13882_c0_g1_i1.p1  ORF type:complete len:367 (-),score=75.87 TRINITY_DN13882_c0_g1_i1:147-1247(-)
MCIRDRYGGCCVLAMANQQRSVSPKTHLIMGILALTTIVPASAKFSVVGYLQDHQMASANFERLMRSGTTIVLHSIEPDETGALEVNISTAYLRTATIARAVNGGKLFVSVGGWGKSAGFATVVADKFVRDRFIGHLVHFCTSNQLNGADLNWEAPNGATEMQSYGELLVELKTEFKKHQLELSVLLHVWQDLGKRALDAVDWVHLIAYDVQSKNGRHSTLEHAQTYVNHIVKTNIERVVVGLRAKIVVGVPCYGRDRMRGVHDMKSGGVIPMTNMGRVQPYREIQEQFQPVWNQDGVPNGMWWNGPGTVRNKARWVVDQELGGVMLWELGQDTVEPQTSLLSAVRNVFDDQKSAAAARASQSKEL